ncbi:MAG: GTPase HflX [Candidatus Tenebribacter davisii]|nr:GTPase HflX [Candidatus Tenebribacter davisii]
MFLISVRCVEETIEHFNESIEELRQLADTADCEAVSIFSQALKRPNTSTYIGKGKLHEIKDAAHNLHVHTLIFNNNLSPSQSRNISDVSGCNVVDRTEIILDIFAKHARTKQAKLQVELAQLEYAYTKLKGKWEHLSRIQGGIGFRGPGETQIEVDRREIRKKTTTLKKKIDSVNKISITKRKKRKNITSIALVGYTNAGKSTLFNKLTNEKRYTANQLFATLDAKTRAVETESDEDLVITDTIGFIRKLPHRLVSSFHSTLLEVLEADLLLHVVDVSYPNLLELMQAVESVLEEMKVDNKNELIVFNKTDKMNGKYYLFLKKKLISLYPDSVFISAITGQGLIELNSKIVEFIQRRKKYIELDVPADMHNLISFLHKNAEIIACKYIEKKNIQSLKLKISRQLLDGVKKQIKNYELLEYINNKKINNKKEKQNDQ